MSTQNLDVVRAIYRAFAARKFPAELLAEGFVWVTAPDVPGGGSHEGHDAVRAYFRDWVAAWHEVESEVQELIDRSDVVVAIIRGRYRLAPDGEQIEASYTHVWTLRDGKAVEARVTGG